MHHTDIILGFAAKLVPLVKDGSKTLTYRLGDKYSFLKSGDTILVEDSSTNQPFAEIEVTSVSRTTFLDLPLDGKGHETYESKEKQRKEFEKMYKRPVADDETVIVIAFRVVTLLT
ncbi:MAG: ASCH domain-containing protein [Patescibacteria group bacterium]|nr:ASCH domain-containing protein [Patescibacteria group bacterium]